MQRTILKSKNQITFISGLLIILAFISNWALKNESMFEILLVIASIIGVSPIAIQAYQAVRVKVISIDLLVTIAVLGAFVIRNFEESAIVTFLFLFGGYLEMRTLNSTRSAIKELVDMAPESALRLMANGEYEEIDVDDVEVGDTLLVKTGAKVPVDGTVISGEGSINEASITGESIPVSKEVNLDVFAGTILDNGTLQIVANRVGEDTTFGKIIELVEEAQDSKSEAERFIDKFAKYYTPAVLVLSLIVFLLTLDMELAITILVLGCPGALVIGVPVSNVAGIGNGAKNGVLLKGSEVISDFSRVDTIVFDKTGTLTEGNPSVASKTLYDASDDDLVYLASIEQESDHPLAKAVLNDLGINRFLEVSETEVVRGGGVVATVNNQRVSVGNLSLMEDQGVTISDELRSEVARLELEGNSIVISATNKEVKVLLGIKDKIRDGIKKDLDALRKLKVKNLIMLSGDNQGTVDLVSKELGLTEAFGNMLPEDKSAYVKMLIEEKNQIVAFVGDGINDSPSLALAQIGIAMGSGTDVAIETSDVVLMNSDMSHLPHALGLVKATANNMIQNIVIAVGVVLVLLASVLFSDWMNMTIGMLVHELSILVVIVNGMRLLRYKLKLR